MHGTPRPPPYKGPGTMAVQFDQNVDRGTVSSLKVSVLPDSGADVSVAGLAVLESLNEYPDNLLPSKVIPRAVNGTTMSPIRKLPVTVSLNTAQLQCVDEFHIYPQVNGALLSWKAARGLKILSESYPHPPPTSVPPQECIVIIELWL